MKTLFTKRPKEKAPLKNYFVVLTEEDCEGYPKTMIVKASRRKEVKMKLKSKGIGYWDWTNIIDYDVVLSSVRGEQ